MPDRRRWGWLGLLVAVAVAAGLALAPWEGGGRPASGWEGRGRGEVKADRIGPTLVVSGTVMSAEQTTIVPKVEILADEPPTYGVFGLAAPTRIIELVPEGTRVGKDEVICRLDPSAYEERARLQRIEVDYARSDRAEADRAVSVAEAELVAFRDGERVRQIRQLEADRALARVDLARASDYLEWSGRMGMLGYVAQSDLAEDRLSRLRAEVAWNRADVVLETYQDWTVEKIVRNFESQVEQARTRLAFAEEQLDASQSRLEHLEGQVAHCTLRAPHDGTVFYSDVWYRDYYQVREGAEVYPGLILFQLPNLAKMEVELYVHERFARLVSEGLAATVTFPAFPGRSYDGRVKTVDLLPTPDWYHFGEWQQFRVVVALDEAPDGLLPEMSAEVEIATEEARSALTVPAEAVAWDDEGPFCVVEAPSGPSRREVRVERGTVDRLVVLDGLGPGDVVLLGPRRPSE